MTAGKHILVTGGAGFIGSHLVERLLREGNRVMIVDDLSTGSLENLTAVQHDPRLAIVESRVATCPDLETLVRDAEFIYHLAATVGVELVLSKTTESILNNSSGAEAILLLAAEHRVPTLVASSSEVYGRSSKAIFSEEDDLVIGSPRCARWSYAASKLMSECLSLALARDRGLAVTIARIFNTVGPRQSGRYGMVLPRFVASARANRPLRVFGTGTQTRCFCWVGDTVEALVRLAENPKARGSIVNVGNDHETSILELAQLVVATWNSSSLIQLVPYAEAHAGGFEDLERRRPDLTNLEKLTGFRPQTDLVEILRRL